MVELLDFGKQNIQNTIISMPRILRILNRFNLGGPTHVGALLTKHLEPDFQTLLVAGYREESEAGSEDILKNLGIEPNYVPHMRRSLNDPLADLKALRYVVRLIEDFRPDIIHTHAAKAGVLGRIAAKYCGVKVVVHSYQGHVFHSYFSKIKTQSIIGVERSLAKISHAIVAISTEQKKELAFRYRIAPEDKIYLIPDGFDLSPFAQDQENKRKAFRKKYNLQDHHCAIGIIGRLVPIKNHELFLRALVLLNAKEKENARFFIIGDGELKSQLELQAKKWGLNEPLLRFTSWIFPIDEALAGLDVVVLTSLNEGAPVTLIEAQAAGKPVIATQVGGVADCTLCGQSGILTPSGDAQALAEAMEILIHTPEWREKMGETGREFAVKHFHFSRMVQDMKELYNHLLVS